MNARLASQILFWLFAVINAVLAVLGIVYSIECGWNVLNICLISLFVATSFIHVKDTARGMRPDGEHILGFRILCSFGQGFMLLAALKVITEGDIDPLMILLAFTFLGSILLMACAGVISRRLLGAPY